MRADASSGGLRRTNRARRDEPFLPYNRPPLSKELLRDDLPDELVLAEPERWYERRSVELVTGRRVAALDLDARRARSKMGPPSGSSAA